MHINEVVFSAYPFRKVADDVESELKTIFPIDSIFHHNVINVLSDQKWQATSPPNT